MNKTGFYEKGICDSCGNYSSKLTLDNTVGWWKCQKCHRKTEKEVEQVYKDRAKQHGGIVVLYPDEKM